MLNFTFISAIIITSQYGSVTLSPGEKYIMNIPFLGLSKISMICGKAQTTSGKPVKGVNVSVFYQNNLVNKSTTNSKGEYCVTLPEVTSIRTYKVQVDYEEEQKDGENITLASNDYTVRLVNNLTFSKSLDKVAFLQGTIENKNAPIENGRFEAKVRRYDGNSWKDVYAYKKYFLNIDPLEVYEIPNSEFNVSWEIPEDAELGRYQFYVRTSFNGKEKQQMKADFEIVE